VSQAARSAGERSVALLYSPSLQGHRLTYCRVLSDILVGLGFRVVVAGRGLEPPVASDPLLADLANRPGVTVRDLGAPNGTPPATAVAAQIRRARAAVTVLTEADDLLDALAARRRHDAPALGGRLIGLFLRSTNYQYHPRPSAVSRAKTRLAARRDGRIGEAVFHDGLLPRRSVLDAALVLDERFALAHPRSHQWMPDIFREFGEPSREAAAETRDWKARLAAFLAGCTARPVIVYTGPSDPRRGYDILLKLCLDENGCFLHCGERDLLYEASSGEVPALRAALAARGALLETGGPYLHADTAAAFLRAASCVVLPYRRHDGSSGSMLQALAAGRPVLMPDHGLSAWRVRSFGLGAVYREGDDDDLRRRFHELHDRSAPDGAALAEYVGLFSREQVTAAVSRAVGGRGAGARLPAIELGGGADAAAAGS
jgi:glycosyltransferase involved in cell wall biosynthesis